MSRKKKEAYSTPKLESLGSVGAITRSAEHPFSDALPFQDNTAHGPSAS